MRTPILTPSSLKLPLSCEHVDKGLCGDCRARLQHMLELVNVLYGGPPVTLEDFN